MADPQNPVKVTAMAMNGQAIRTDDLIKPLGNLPSPGRVVNLNASIIEDKVPDVDIDYTDLAKVTEQLVALKTKFALIRHELREAERAVIRTRWAYEGQKKRYLIQISGGTEKTREGAAEIYAEAEMGEYLVAQQVAKEIATIHRDLKSELDLLKDISYNLRRLMDI